MKKLQAVAGHFCFDVDPAFKKELLKVIQWIPGASKEEITQWYHQISFVCQSGYWSILNMNPLVNIKANGFFKLKTERRY